MKPLKYSSQLNIEGLQYTIINDQEVELTSPSGQSLILKDSRVILSLQKDRLKMMTNSRNKGHLRALFGTWKSIISRAVQDKMYEHQVTAVFKHFPISMTLQEGCIRVHNYLGGKQNSGVPAVIQIPVPEGVVATLIDPRNVVLRSRDIIKLGNTTSAFKQIRYKTHGRNIDRRVFWDGFLIDKSSF